jgi:hypothetical protein
MQIIEVEVQNVEIIPFPHPVEHHHVVWNGVSDTRIEAQGMRRAGHELGGGDGFPTRKQGDLMPLLD